MSHVTYESIVMSGGVLVVDAKTVAKRLAQEPTVLMSTDVQELATALDKALPPFERRYA